MKDRLDILAADLEPYRGRTVGSLRIGMDEVQKILALLDASRAQPVAVTETPSDDTQSPLFSADDHQDQVQPIDDEALVERLRDAEPFSAHRLAAEARAEKLVEALEGWADWHRKACIDSDDDLTYINGDGWADAGKLAEQARAALSEYAGEGRR